MTAGAGTKREAAAASVALMQARQLVAKMIGDGSRGEDIDRVLYDLEMAYLRRVEEFERTGTSRYIEEWDCSDRGTVRVAERHGCELRVNAAEASIRIGQWDTEYVPVGVMRWLLESR